MLTLFFQNIVMAFEELRNNKLRTFLSLLGVTIGVFCVISILTVFDSLQRNIQSNMQTLGSNVLYIGKFPWIPEEEGEYQWWKYKARPMFTDKEMNLINGQVQLAAYAAICYSDETVNLKYDQNETKGTNVFAVTYEFNKLQPIDITDGRYFSLSEMQGTQSNAVVIGANVAEGLFGESISPIGKYLNLFSRKFQVIGVMKKQGKTMTGFNFDDGIIVSYHFLASIKNIDNQFNNGFTDPMLMVKAREGKSLEEMKYEIRSVLRANRRLRPNEPDNFSFNQLDAIQNSLDAIFVIFKTGAWLIGGFSLLVGCFGIANIMFVSVKERTSQIGVKKALGARPKLILVEFLTESIILCLLGGFIGIVLVLILSYILSGKFDFPVTMSFFNFILGMGISAIVGVLAGFIPARKASRLDPVVAIRSS